MSNSLGAAETDPLLYLEIVRGSTDFPNRPVYEGMFLIGSGSNCDLRLGGVETPAVHSIIRAEGTEVYIESLCRKPPLRVNGQPCAQAIVRDGSTVQIGAIQMVARFRAQAAAAAADDETSLLIERLERDLALVAEHEENERTGATLLIEAARRVQTGTPADSADVSGIRVVDPDEDLYDTASETEQLVVALNRIADDLNGRVDDLTQREGVYREAAEELLAMQHRFATLLERVLERLPADGDSPEHRRRSA